MGGGECGVPQPGPSALLLPLELQGRDPRERQGNLCELEANLGYTVSSGLHSGTQPQEIFIGIQGHALLPWEDSHQRWLRGLKFQGF